MITTEADLRRLYPAPRERSQRKQLPALERHSRRFIALSPFVVLASAGAGGMLDASPRGGAPGFVQAPDDHTLWLPDGPGNNRLDTLQNILAGGRLGLLFLVPGIDETLRVNGRARLLDEGPALAAFAAAPRPPKLVIEVAVEEVYLHCAKAFMRSRLWDPAARVERGVMPSMGEMMKEQIGLDGPAETQAEMLARYAADL